MKLSELRENPKNPSKCSEKDLERLAGLNTRTERDVIGRALHQRLTRIELEDLPDYNDGVII